MKELLSQMIKTQMKSLMPTLFEDRTFSSVLITFQNIRQKLFQGLQKPDDYSHEVLMCLEWLAIYEKLND